MKLIQMLPKGGGLYEGEELEHCFGCNTSLSGKECKLLDNALFCYPRCKV